MASIVKDDVDRLFECFKCGVSPPQSAVRGIKKRKSKLKSECSVNSEISASASVEERPENATDVQDSVEKIGLTSEAKGSSCKKFSPIVFYGSPRGVPPKRPYSLWKLLREIRVDLSEQTRFKLSKQVWATFPRQEEAIKFAREHTGVHVFSYQDHFNGQRRFLVSSYNEFWQRYKSMDSKFRHHYEVIQEGAPCHLYFDLEYSKRINTGKNGDVMVDSLILVILEALNEKYSIQGSFDWILELDSSNEEKFSRHLIIRIPKMAFKDNSHAGAFVGEICSRIYSAKMEGRYEELFIKKDSSSTESPSHLFVDNAVYSRNRCFRLAFSSKAGKTSVLLPTGRHARANMCEEDTFMASLICNVDAECEKLLVCKMDLDCVKTLQFEMEEKCNFGRHFSFAKEVPLTGCMTDVSATSCMGRSPFPAVDKFVESVASTGSVSGKIRCWYWFSEYGLIVYSMSRNRYCERIGREHKSNHVIYVVDLRRAAYYQKCHDPDCRGYRSPLRPIPIDALPSPWVSTDSEQILNDTEFNDDRINYQSLSNDQNCLLLFSDKKNITDSSVKDSWWLEAIRVADDVENKRNMDIGKLDFEEDDDWWMAVENSIKD
ncbi:DNA-directed primase/polymerase protein [Momordica charantia]|uniref:DNA-directed primase/polymerase protein n=1 Tax=Momordica charantia TaxID=3673 RepID=A0A6J1CHF5_MOMCH|nr:DNA-directed primase/polymerase protein [Momordica charantia]